MTDRLDPDRALAVAASLDALAHVAQACAELANARGPGRDPAVNARAWRARAAGILEAVFPGAAGSGDHHGEGQRLAQDLMAAAGVELIAHRGSPFVDGGAGRLEVPAGQPVSLVDRRLAAAAAAAMPVEPDQGDPFA